MMFEDAAGGFFNRDTLGKRFALRAGDLYWLAAAGGAAHEEVPEAGARTHALQIFVNLPGRLKHGPAYSLLVRAEDVPVIEAPGHRVRVVLGQSGDIRGATGTPEPFTLLDVTLAPGGAFAHPLPSEEMAWIYVISGAVTLHSPAREHVIEEGRAISVRAGMDGLVRLEADTRAHAVLMAARPIREIFVKHGPVVMSTTADVRLALIDYADGRFGEMPPAP
jgi:redox-sensitive bicupin YhaK (pirin superfamily)